jgi:gas vesicle protein
MNMTAVTEERRDHNFAIGLLTGTVVGAGLALWFAPRLASEVRERVTDSVKTLGLHVSEQYQRASARVGGAVDEVSRTGRDIKDDVADAVASGAHEVERYATAAKSEPAAEAPASRSVVQRRNT